jgi:hypothetical protein
MSKIVLARQRSVRSVSVQCNDALRKMYHLGAVITPLINKTQFTLLPDRLLKRGKKRNGFLPTAPTCGIHINALADVLRITTVHGGQCRQQLDEGR